MKTVFATVLQNYKHLQFLQNTQFSMQYPTWNHWYKLVTLQVGNSRKQPVCYCQNSEETYRHLFYYCSITSAFCEEAKCYTQSKLQTCIDFNCQIF